MLSWYGYQSRVIKLSIKCSVSDISAPGVLSAAEYLNLPLFAALFLPAARRSCQNQVSRTDGNTQVNYSLRNDDKFFKG